MRKRTGTRYVPITISMLPDMVNDIEGELGRKQSRSEWIADAITKKLAGQGWNLVDDGDAVQWFVAFKGAMDRLGVKIDTMFYQIIESNCKEARQLDVETTTSTDEH